MTSPEEMSKLKRLVRVFAIVDAWPDCQGEVLRRLRLDETTLARDRIAFGSAFASLTTSERSELTELHRLQSAAIKDGRVGLEDLPESEPVTRRNPLASHGEAIATAITEEIDSIRVASSVTPFAGETTPQRLAVIRACYPLDPAVSEDGDTALAPLPYPIASTPWSKSPA